jgi:hypothetical protein
LGSIFYTRAPAFEAAAPGMAAGDGLRLVHLKCVYLGHEIVVDLLRFGGVKVLGVSASVLEGAQKGNYVLERSITWLTASCHRATLSAPKR